MEYSKALGMLSLGDEIEGFYILKSVFPKVAANGKPFLNLVLSDNSGAIDGKVWDYSGPIGNSDEGKVVKTRGIVTEFRGTLQVTIERIRLADSTDNFNSEMLVAVAPINRNEMSNKVSNLLSSIEDEEYRRLALELLHRHEKSFASIPAAKSVHHDFIGGLLMHTCNMLELADHLSQLYSDTVDRSLLIAGTFAHDLKKDKEFVFSQLGLVTDYSVYGQLLGHLVMGAQEITEVAKELNISEEKSLLMQHMVLSHHGEPEFGAAVRPACAESELLSYIDMIDSRMEIYRKTLEELQPGEFSKRIFALEKKIYKHN